MAPEPERGKAPPPRTAPWPRAARRLRLALGWALVAAATVYLVRAFDARRLAPLEVWHTARLSAEFSAGDARADYGFEHYLAQETLLFEQLDREVYARAGERPELGLSRFRAGGSADPRGLGTNWNRSFELAPEGEPAPGAARGAALLLHGLSDSPYSLRRVSALLRARGWHVLGLRLPGHGTAPAALARVHWRDWMAAVRLGARRAGELAGGGPLLVVGYSAGGTLAVRYAAEAALDPGLPRPARLILLSPALDVTPFARAAGWHRLVSWIPYFERFAWQTVQPEYDAFKYNSFPKRAGREMHALAADTRARLAAVRAAGRAGELPPVLAFQSLVDATVPWSAVLEELFAHLPSSGSGPSSGSELVLFDVNDQDALRPFVVEPDRTALERAARDPARRYRLTHVVNRGPRTSEVAALSYPPGGSEPERRDLGLSWPADVYSLSHVAMPFAPDDPHYGSWRSSRGSLGAESPAEGLTRTLGALQPRGERGALRVSIDDLMRLRCNPFQAFVEERIAAVLE